MRKGLLSIALCLFILPVAMSLAAAGETTYGEGVSSRETVAVSTLLADPDAYVGKVVRVQGPAVGVCEHRGCWINIGADKDGESVRVKVQDGVIVFPPEILGETVIAEGVWTANKLDLETTKAYCGAQAEKTGDKFNPESVTECMTLYQITGTGAVVLERAAAPAAEQSLKG
ncbi:MAG: DUF4920 domain-containing protein [Candidatus Krumholzibacteriia bacterium]|nr:DUF4920 domain-containing protein [bacterium]MCB9517221.1 DUF4920 domain-containing protein [Candidatus Latescibacterota bacterium]